MADLLASGLWWLHGTRGSNVYIVEADDGELVLVDTGFASSATAILEEVTALGKPLSAILLTHMHRDHSGAAAAVYAATGARVVAGLADCRENDQGLFLRAAVGRSHVGRFLLARAGQGHQELCPVHLGVAEDREVLPGIRAVLAPGHTPGSLCFLVDRLGAAFVGDLVISHGGELTRSLRMANHNDAQYLDSIRQFATHAPDAGLPGHGKPVMAGFGAALRELAVLPRRKAGFRTTLERFFRMARFGKGMSRRRSRAASDR